VGVSAHELAGHLHEREGFGWPARRPSDGTVWQYGKISSRCQQLPSSCAIVQRKSFFVPATVPFSPRELTVLAQIRDWEHSWTGLNPVLHLHPGYQPPPRASCSGLRVACEQKELHIQCVPLDRSDRTPRIYTVSLAEGVACPRLWSTSICSNVCL
jgi:hypothetical protein